MNDPVAVTKVRLFFLYSYTVCSFIMAALASAIGDVPGMAAFFMVGACWYAYDGVRDVFFRRSK